MSEANPVVFTYEAVKRVGTMANVLDGFLTDQIERIDDLSQQSFPNLPPHQRSVASLLAKFITDDRTKKPLKRNQILIQTEMAGLDPTAVTLMIKELEKARILRDHEGQYELAHDTLALLIEQKALSPAEIEYREVKKLLLTRFENHQKTQTYLSASELAWIDKYRNILEKKDEEVSTAAIRFVDDSQQKVNAKRRRNWMIAFGVMGVLSALLFDLRPLAMKQIAQVAFRLKCLMQHLSIILTSQLVQLITLA